MRRMMNSMTEAVIPGTVPEWTLGWRMQRALAHAGMSVEQMAGELGVSRSTISRWLNDRGAAPRAAYLKLWALRTGVPYGWLRGDDGPRAVRGVTVRGSTMRCSWTSGHFRPRAHLAAA